MESSGNISRNIYTDLDTMYDTKLTVLNMIDSRLAIEYVSREYDIPDQILYVNESVLDYYHKSGDKRILLGSKNSSVVDLIRTIVSDIDIKAKEGGGIRGDLNLIINTYPYELNNDECNAIKEFHKQYILYLSDVKVIYKKELDYGFLSSLNIMIRRDGLDWFMKNKLKHPEFKLTNLKLIIPDEISTKYTKDLKLDKEKLLEYMEVSFMNDITLEFIEKELFMFKLDDVMSGDKK